MNSIRSCASTEMIVDAVQPTHPSYPTVSLCLLFFSDLSQTVLFSGKWPPTLCSVPRTTQAPSSWVIWQRQREELVFLSKLVIAPSIPRASASPWPMPMPPFPLASPVPGDACLELLFRPSQRPFSHFVSEGKMGRSMAGGKSFNN
ncbi:hypothetical protein NEUTE1DRAFT_50469 [Neurospora tetrasperma FGSC 2508]|uniref:Uncharacterized protein n=1 Tax=Neurospora tetrasperma (strain FGSC 2508 / ATCC MYA-4615 / P0657) TaxID=510951 RepID=F8MXT3_NEUT8|nr:uncharacterized protein NEUTE1DRAFT_50469 [Neurospora tetrasperma FGSC 2508]EGO53891.1 hypothetical protein NEUTE1DRAFT_50469 [Neurospora tetrasperma FGSC 2508]